MGLFVFLAVESCLSCFYLLEMNPLSVASFANISSRRSERVVFWSCLWFPLLCKSFEVSSGPMGLSWFLFPRLWEVGPKGSCGDLGQSVFSASVFL